MKRVGTRRAGGPGWFPMRGCRGAWRGPGPGPDIPGIPGLGGGRPARARFRAGRTRGLCGLGHRCRGNICPCRWCRPGGAGAGNRAPHPVLSRRRFGCENSASRWQKTHPSGSGITQGQCGCFNGRAGWPGLGTTPCSASTFGHGIQGTSSSHRIRGVLHRVAAVTRKVRK